tara:strand:- start:195 stop:539 length:345 start_codon:yes stop_codon:yes gene_type:complete
MNIFLKNNNFIIIAIGTVPAAILRWKVDHIPLVNIIGCFLLGFINSYPLSKRYKLILGFGFCGSLTSFSGWSLKLFELINQGYYKLFFCHSILIVVFGLLAIYLGKLVAKNIIN